MYSFVLFVLASMISFFLLKKTFLIFIFHFIETAWLFDFCKVIRVI